MEVNVKEPVIKYCMQPFGIKQEDIHKTITQPTSEKVIHLEGYTIVLLLRKFEDYFILVDGRFNRSQNILRSLVFYCWMKQ
jgi:hypothetical protein